MTRRIQRNDPAYETAMREAKALFDAAMAKSAMKGRGRPAARPAAPTVPVDIEPDEAELADSEIAEIAAEAVAAAPPEPPPSVARAEKSAEKAPAKTAAKPASKSAAKTATKSATK